MHRSTVRLLAVFVLALLGAPVAMHVVMHDLHDHHEAATDGYEAGPTHGDHEHPVVSSPGPQMPGLARAALPIVVTTAAAEVTWNRLTTEERNIVSLGALRTDDDVGLQPLLSTFLI